MTVSPIYQLLPPGIYQSVIIEASVGRSENWTD